MKNFFIRLYNFFKLIISPLNEKLGVYIRNFLYKNVFPNLNKTYKRLVTSEFSVFNVIKIGIMAHILLLLVNPYSSFYHGFYLIYKCKRLQTEIQVLEQEVLIAEKTLQGLKEGSQDVWEEMLLNNGTLISSKKQLFVLEE